MPRHEERRVLAHSPQQLYTLVAEVQHYPEFLPWCLAVRIRERKEKLLVADLVIGFKVFRERFTSRVELDPDALRIDVTYAEGPFRYLQNHWIFNPHPKGCEIDFYVDFEFRSKIMQSVMQALFHEAVKRMVRAFEARAQDIYGPAAPSGST